MGYVTCKEEPRKGGKKGGDVSIGVSVLLRETPRRRVVRDDEGRGGTDRDTQHTQRERGNSHV